MIVDVHSHAWEYPGHFTDDFRRQAMRARAGVEVDLTVRYEEYRRTAPPDTRTVVFGGKAAAALISARMLGLSRPQGRLLYGLSLAQAAATLAAVIIGVDIGLFDTDLLNATLVVVLFVLRVWHYG